MRHAPYWAGYNAGVVRSTVQAACHRRHLEASIDPAMKKGRGNDAAGDPRSKNRDFGTTALRGPKKTRPIVSELIGRVILDVLVG